MLHRTRLSRFCGACVGIAALVFTVFSFSCATTPTHYRGSLSDAMEKSTDDYEGDRSVPDGQRSPQYVPPSQYPVVDYAGSAETGSPGASASGPSEFWLGLRGGNGYHSSRDMEPLADGDILAGGEVSPYVEVDLHVGFKVTQAVTGSDLDASVKDPLLFLKAGLEGRYTPFPRWLVMSPYVSAGMGTFYMGWNFRNALSSGPDVITSDSIAGFMMSVGAGVYVVHLERFRLAIVVQPELYLFGTITGEGFDNDYFDYVDSIKVVAELAVKL